MRETQYRLPLCYEDTEYTPHGDTKDVELANALLDSRVLLIECSYSKLAAKIATKPQPSDH